MYLFSSYLYSNSDICQSVFALDIAQIHAPVNLPSMKHILYNNNVNDLCDTFIVIFIVSSI